jgi:hypothetical protein
MLSWAMKPIKNNWLKSKPLVAQNKGFGPKGEEEVGFELSWDKK